MFWCPGSILRTRKDCLSLSGPRYFGPSFVSDGSQETDTEEDGEMVSTPKVFRHKTRRKKRKRFNPYLPTAPCDESTWEPEDEVVSCPVVTSDMSVSDALAAVACRATSCTKWEDAAVTCAEIAEATCAPGSTAYDLAEAWLLSSQDEEVLEVGILAALTRSLVPGIAERADPSELRLVSANVTAWNKEALEWYRQDPHRLWLVQETHLTPKTIEPFRVQVHKAGLTAYGGLGTMHPLSNRAWGGVAVVAPKHLNCRFIKEFVAEGCGFVLVGVPGVAGEILVGSVYLKSGVGLQCSPNPEIFAALAGQLIKGCRKWVLGGDWNCPAQDFVKTSLESVTHGKICSEGVPTSDSGRTLDFFFLSNDLANLGEPSTCWEVPFRPHAAISLTLRQELLLQPLPSLVGVGKAPPAQWKIGDVDVKCVRRLFGWGASRSRLLRTWSLAPKGWGGTTPLSSSPEPRRLHRKSGPERLRPCGVEWLLTWLEDGVHRRLTPPNVLKEAGLLRTCPTAVLAQLVLTAYFLATLVA